MQIAYLNKGKIKAKSKTDQMLEYRYARDIHKAYLKYRQELAEVGVGEIDFVKMMKKKLNEQHGIFADVRF